MKRFLTLATLPVVGAALLVVAFLWSQRDLRLRILGQPADGRVLGMAVQRPSGATDLLTGVDTDLVLTQADGDRIAARFENYAPVSASWHPQAGGAPQPLSPEAIRDGNAVITPETARVLNDAVRGEAEIIRWSLLRESRRPDDPNRIVRIEKNETIHGYFDLTELPIVLSVKDGRVSLDPQNTGAPPLGRATIRTVFDRSDPDLVQKNKNETLVRYEYLRNGAPFVPAKRDFFLFAEPYATQFRPVFGFEVAGTPLARVSHIGRHGGPTLALRLYEDVGVFFDPANPADAILIARPGPVNGDPLGWFSRLCEGIFAQWGSTSLILIAALTCFLVGGIFISLAIWPRRRAGEHSSPPSAH